MALVLVTALGVDAAVLTCSASAQGAPPNPACADSCKAAYGACYKSTANRDGCMAQLRRCLQGCEARPR